MTFNYFKAGIFSLAIILSPSFINAQVFYDGFESGSYTPTWSDGVGAYTRTVTATAPAVGSQCFSITGGSSSHYDGIIGTFPPSQATSVSWYVKGTGTAHAGYIVIGDASTTTNNGVAFVRITDLGTLRFYNNTNWDYPITANTWYHVEMRDIDWVNKHFDIWIDGVLQATDYAFRSTTSTDMSVIHFYNYHSSTAYLDEVQVNVLPPCTTAPTAVCTGITVDLDATGNATILGSDLDGGSIDNCSTSGLTFTASQTTFDCNDVTTAAPGLVITGAYDGPLTGGLPKGIELYATGDIADLSVYGVSSANNGGGATGAPEYTFPPDAVTAGSYIYVTSDSTGFHDFFGFPADYITGSMLINGDDAVELFENTSVIDVFGDVNVDGTGQAWEYLDGWAYRNNMTGPDGNTFVPGNWTYSGINQLEGGVTNGTCTVPFPIGTFMPTPNGTQVTLTVTDGNSNSAQCLATVTVQDITLPTASNLPTVNVECIGDVPAADINDVSDAADNCSATVTWTGDVSDGLTCPETITRTYNVADPHGNSIDVTQTIVVEDITAPTGTAPIAISVECIGDVPAADPLLITDEADNCTAVPVVTWESDVSDGLTCPETITRTYRITDDCGNFSDVTQTITVEDITAPVVNGGLPTATSTCDVTLAAPNGTDNCDGTVTATPDVTFPITAMGLTTVTWTYTDACGNSSTETQDVIISAMDVSTSLTDVTITANNAGQTYQWIDCSNNQAIVGETGQSFTATANGSYAVEIYTGDGCFDTSECVAINNIGLGEVVNTLVSIYPNPTNSGKFTVSVDGQIASIEVYDLSGRAIVLPIDLNTGFVDGSSLSAGKYVVQVTTESDATMQATIIIQ